MLVVAAGHAMLLAPFLIGAARAPVATPQSLTVRLLTAAPAPVQPPAPTPVLADITVPPRLPLILIASRPLAAPPLPRALRSPSQAISAPPAPAPLPQPPPEHIALHPADWQAQVMRRLQAEKHYPLLARDRQEQGIAWISFTLARDGSVRAAALIRSSGSALLDAEALSVIHRADPFPPPPPAFPGAAITLTLPIAFFLE